MALIALARHTQTNWNLEGRIQGQRNVPLNQAGIKEADILAEKLSRAVWHEALEGILCSTQDRALIVAHRIASRMKPTPRVIPDKRLCETSFGSLEGELIASINATHGLGLLADKRTTPYDYTRFGGKNQATVLNRMLEVLQGRHIDPDPFQLGIQYIIVGHGRSLRTLLDYLNEPFALTQGDYQLIEA